MNVQLLEEIVFIFSPPAPDHYFKIGQKRTSVCGSAASCAAAAAAAVAAAAARGQTAGILEKCTKWRKIGKYLKRFKFWWEKSRLGIFFQKILKWFLHYLKDYLRYQKASMGRKVFIFVNKFEVCLFSMNLRAHKKHWVLFLRLKTKNIVKL